MKKSLIIIAMFGSLVLSHAQIYEANLNGLQEVPPNASPATGFGDFSLTGTTFSVTTGSYQDLLGNSTFITLNDASSGTNALIAILTSDVLGATTGTFSGSVPLTSIQITDLQNGNLYVNIRSMAFPSGEICGEILPVPEPSASLIVGCGLASVAFLRRRQR